MGEFAQRIERHSTNTQDAIAAQRAARLARDGAQPVTKPKVVKLATPRVHNVHRDVSGYIRPQAETVLALFRQYGRMTYKELFEAHEVEEGKAITKAACFLRVAELMDLDLIGYTGDSSVDADTGYANKLMDVVENITAEQRAINSARGARLS